MKSGWIILDKPSGMTSRRAGGIVARMFGVKKFGHLGTLDPMASGVLPIALGEATKMIPYIEGTRHWALGTGEKEYLFGIKWGIKTDTDDITGKIIEQDTSAQCPVPSALATACAALVGEIEQTPPAYSAVHIDGKRAYELARRGIEFEMPKRKVVIYGLEMSFPGSGFADAPRNDTYTFKVQCSAGTYVRTLTRDIGALARGSLATTDIIRRTRTHNFEIKDAVGLDFLENLYNNSPADVQEYLHPADFGLDDILVLEINENNAKLFQNGGFVTPTQDFVSDKSPTKSIPPRKGAGAGEAIRRIYSNGKFIGIGVLENNVLKPKRIITT